MRDFETPLDADGQPRNAAFNRRANIDKAIEQLTGICRGLVADRVLNEDEVIYLDAWLKQNADYLERWPASVIAERVRQVLADGTVTEDECGHLRETLEAIVGGDIVETGGLVGASATRLPVEDIESMPISGKLFCLTGKFVYGPRSSCQQAILDRGGVAGPNVLRKTDYLVIGQLSSRDWKHSSYGRKVEKAIELKAAGLPLHIVAEERWTEFL